MGLVCSICFNAESGFQSPEVHRKDVSDCSVLYFPHTLLADGAHQIL